MVQDRTAVDAFTDFVTEVQPRLHRAFEATYGIDVGREATAEALAYGWEHWDRLQKMENPAGYLYRVGRSRARALRVPLRVFPEVETEQWPWVEPALPEALSRLPERQRTVVVLIHSFSWTHAEVAGLLGISRGAVQRHETRALAKLRIGLGGGK